MNEYLYLVFDVLGAVAMVGMSVYWFVKVRYILRLHDTVASVFNCYAVLMFTVAVTRTTSWLADYYDKSRVDEVASTISGIFAVIAVFKTYRNRVALVGLLAHRCPYATQETPIGACPLVSGGSLKKAD